MIVHDLDIDDVKAGLADGSILLVDVREPHEFAAGRIPGSMSRPLSQFDPADLPNVPGKRLVLSCAAGVRCCARSNSRKPLASMSTAIILAASRTGRCAANLSSAEPRPSFPNSPPHPAGETTPAD